MKALVVANHFPVCSARFITDAFLRLGVDVRHIGDSSGAFIPWPPNGQMLPERYAWASDGPLTAHWSDWTPDLVVIADSAFAYHHPVYANVPHVVWGADNHCRDYRQAGVVHYFLMHRYVSVMQWGLTGEKVGTQYVNTTWLPACYDPIWHTPSQIPWEQREYDVAMVGVLYPRRVQLLKALEKAGLKVFATQGLVYEEYRQAYHNARISLCVSANGDLAQRVFETAAMGCLVFTDPVADLVHEDTNKALGLEAFVVYEEEQSLVANAVELLHDTPMRARKAAEKLQSTAMYDPATFGSGLRPEARSAEPQVKVQRHTWDARAKVVVDWWRRTYQRGDSSGL